jgi:hypothetical protein
MPVPFRHCVHLVAADRNENTIRALFLATIGFLVRYYQVEFGCKIHNSLIVSSTGAAILLSHFDLKHRT